MTLDSLWYGPHPARWLLWPLSLMYETAIALRRWLYRHGWMRSERLSVPVIVVGNITVGGTGKTPLVIWLVEQLRARGWRPGIVSRGYGGGSTRWPCEVNASSDPGEVGDEPVLLAQRLSCPIMVGPRRVDAARQLLARHDINIIVSDDGLQHYAMQRDIEIAVVDGQRGLGNGLLLPAGPLRESESRLREVQLVVTNGAEGKGLRMDLAPDAFVRLDGAESLPATAFAGRSVHALAGIGHPERFFDGLRAAGLRVLPHSFPDHYRFKTEDITFPDNIDVVMTEKDAVKCRGFAGPRHWYLAVQARLGPEAGPRLDELLQPLSPRREDA
ncbi:MAG: tetraacyldisaccharide 4'-kinase [Nevskiales bacterium]